jgi:hypothetical protein
MAHDETSDTIGFRKTFTKMVNLALAAWIFLDTVAFISTT